VAVGEKDGPYGEERSRGQDAPSAVGGGAARREVVIARPGSRWLVGRCDRGSGRRQPGSARVRSGIRRLRRPLPDEILSRSSAEGIAGYPRFLWWINGRSSLVRGGARFCPTVRGRCCLARRVVGRWRSRSDCVEVTGSFRFLLRAAFGERHRGAHPLACVTPCCWCCRTTIGILRPPARRPG